MKKFSFSIIFFSFFLFIACGGNPETSQIDNENPAMIAQQQTQMPVTASADEAVTALDNMKTANKPTESAAKEMKEKGGIVDKSIQKGMEKDKTKSQKITTSKSNKKSVASTATLEKPTPMSTEVDNKVKVMPNKAEKTIENTPTAGTDKKSEGRTSKTVANDNTVGDETTESTTVIAKPNHSAWDKVLRANVSSSGKVNYSGIKAQQAQLDSYLKDLENNPPQSDWSRNEKLAYWINVYNAYTVKLIVKNYPVKSITDLEGGKPWDKKWIKIDGKTYSLNNVENDIIRPRFNEPRIHFAVNCAAQSCPPLLNQAWTADNLNSNLTKQAKAFINNDKFNQISSKSVTVSKIFDWYGKDFGNLISYLNKYSNKQISADATVNYKEYNWGLNN